MTIKFIVSHDFDMAKPTLPPGKKNDDPEKKQTLNSRKANNFNYRPHRHRDSSSFTQCLTRR